MNERKGLSTKNKIIISVVFAAIIIAIAICLYCGIKASV
jgi:hypothetical protein